MAFLCRQRPAGTQGGLLGGLGRPVLGCTAVYRKGVAVQNGGGASLLSHGVLHGNAVTHIQGDDFPVLGSGDGVEDILSLQADEIVGVALQHSGADFRHGAAGLSLGQLLSLGDALVGELADILLLTLGHGGGHGNHLILGHVYHGVALHQVVGVLQGDEIGGLSSDVQQLGGR